MNQEIEGNVVNNDINLHLFAENLKKANHLLENKLELSQYKNTRDEYSQLLSLLIKRRDEVFAYDRFLRTETAWLTAPASTRFHLACENGLLKHSINVARILLKLRDILAPELSWESCIIVGLFHDTGKAGVPGKPYYLTNPSEWHRRNRGIYYIVNPELIHIDIPSRSLYIASRYISLSEEEAQAIRYHDGQYIDENRSVAHRETKLTRLLQYADNWSGGIMEATNANSFQGDR